MKTITNNITDEFCEEIKLPSESLFKTDIDLWEIYLNSFYDSDVRQYHNCNTCKAFIRKYGNLVTINKEGETQSAAWVPDNASKGYLQAIVNMKKAVEKSKVIGVLVSSDKVLGNPETKEWTHFYAKNPNVFRNSILSAGQKSAEKKEEYINISRYLSKIELYALEQVVELLKTDSLYRSEKILGQAEWLYGIKSRISVTLNNLYKKNIIWKAIADAPSGFCHPNSGMIGTLIEDIVNGLSFDVAARRFKDKMHPLQYRRPTAAPKTASIENAEKLVKKLGVEKSLERRFASLDDMQKIWIPNETEEGKSDSVFGHLKEKHNDIIVSKAGNITWVKFEKDVLQNAKKIEIYLPYGLSSYTVFTTALHDDAPVIFQWGNPVSWYFWHGGNHPSQFGLESGWIDVSAVCFMPYMWEGKEYSHWKKDISFIICGAHESKQSGNALFPETLKTEFHGIRSVIEAHSKKMEIHDNSICHAVGKGLGSNIRVHTSVVTEYTIDRWD